MVGVAAARNRAWPGVRRIWEAEKGQSPQNPGGNFDLYPMTTGKVFKNFKQLNEKLALCFGTKKSKNRKSTERKL